MRIRASWAAAVTILASALVLAQAAQWPVSARFGPVTVDSGRCAIALASVGAPGKSTGLRDGDVLQLQQMDAQARAAVVYHYALLHAVPLGSTITLPVLRDGALLSVPYRVLSADRSGVFLSKLIFKLAILSIGILVLWRGRDRAAWWLGLWCSGIAIALPDGWWGWGPFPLRVFGTLLNNTLWTLLPFVLYMVVESIVTTARAQIMWAARTAMIVSLLPQLILNVVDANAQTLTGCSITGLNPQLANALFVGTQLIIVVYFIAGYAAAHGIERMRLRWVFWAFVFSRIGVLLNLINRLSLHPLQLSGIEWFTIVLFPMGCAYAILRHRLIDINFVLNRTLIYTALTSIVVVVFVLLEYVLNNIAVSRGVGLITEATVALAIGISFNTLHKRVEHFLDRTLFRAKYEAATHLQALAEEAPYIESRDALLDRAVADIPRAFGASAAAIYERVENDYRRVIETGLDALPMAVDADDAAFVRLRKRLSQVDLAEVESALGSDAVAFAFAVRGELTGAFLCGRKTNGEAFSPDEIALLRSVVHEVGAELHAMRARDRDQLLNGLLSGSIKLGDAQSLHAAPPLAGQKLT